MGGDGGARKGTSTIKVDNSKKPPLIYALTPAKKLELARNIFLSAFDLAHDHAGHSDAPSHRTVRQLARVRSPGER